MYTRVILGNDIWFVVDESLEEITAKFNDEAKTFTARVIDGYDISVVKDRVLCLVSVNIAEELNIPLVEAEEAV